jgi:hypothetical protein
MQELLKRLESNHEFEIIVFNENMILNEPVEQWPKVVASNTLSMQYVLQLLLSFRFSA